MKKGTKKAFRGEEDDPEALIHWARRFAEYLRVRNYSGRTVITTESCLKLFIEWANDRDLVRPADITKPILDTYQRWLFHFRKPSGKPLTFSSQRVRLQKLKNFFKWLAKENVILSNPASELEMPRIERRIPRAILTEREMEKVLAQPDTMEVFGLRDRAMMEVLYSTGIRRHELANIELVDVDADRGTVTVRQGKGKKDRTVPIGARALGSIAKYLDASRPALLTPPEETALFLNERGERLDLNYLTRMMRQYIDATKLGKTGACHIFRHTMATLMLEGGADIRHIQEILGHVETSTTAIYTRVSIQHLKQVHEATHPAARAKRLCGELETTPALGNGAVEGAQQQLFSFLAAEAAEEASDGASSGDALAKTSGAERRRAS